jgi:ligand-binding SRPBCC domain-containing protein
LKIFEYSFVVDASVDKVWNFYTDLHHLDVITPKKIGFKIIKSNSNQIIHGQTARLSAKLLTRMTWKTTITFCTPYTYVDEMSEGLFKHWKHTHVFHKLGKNQTRIADKIEFELPYGFIGKLFERYAQDRLEKIFAYRQSATIKALSNS